MTDLEKQVAELWMEVLNVPAGTIAADSSFLDLGGDSLAATEMRGRLRERYAVELPLSELFESATVAHVAALIEQSRTGSGNRGATEDTEIEEGEL